MQFKFMSNRVNISCSTHPSRFCLIFPSTNIIHTHTHTLIHIYNFSNTKMHDECVRLCWSSVLEHRSCIRRSHIRFCVRVHPKGASVSWFTESKWVRGSRRMVGKNSGPPCLPFPFASTVLRPLWYLSDPPATLLHVPLATLKLPATLNRRVPPFPLPSRPARRFFPRFPYLSDIPLPASTRVDIRLIRLKSWREATNYYAS